jgi:hypothetical protein
MDKKKHHYVPRFYLKRFASKPKRINVYHLETNRLVQDASLKKQCQRPRFYGTSADVENDLMKLEDVVSPAIADIVDHSQLPMIASKQHTHLLLFAAFQLARTPFAAGSMSDGFNKMVELVDANNPSGVRQFEGERMERDFAVQESLRTAGLVAEYWADLGLHLMVNKSEESLITSDHPVVLYNKYCEGIQGFGTTGANKTGLQVFLPLSPRHLVLLYDKRIYKVGAKDSLKTEIVSLNDLHALNQLQIVNADKIILFSDSPPPGEIAQLAQRSKKYRRATIAEVEEFVAEDNPERESLLKLYPVPLNVQLDLSFVRLRRRIQSVRLRHRALEYRDQPPPDTIKRGVPAYPAKKFIRRDLVGNK